MSRTTAQALLIPGVTLLTLTGVLIPFEPMAATLVALEPVERLTAIGPAVALVTTVVFVAAAALWHAPRAAWSRIAGAAAAGATAALVLTVSAPHWLENGASPVALLR